MKTIKHEMANFENNRSTKIEGYEGVALHRCGVNLKYSRVLGYNARPIIDVFEGRAEGFEEAAKAVGHKHPYQCMIGGNLGSEEFNGKVWQCLPFDRVGPHARRYSSRYISVGLIGDFRMQDPSHGQWCSALDLVSMLLDMIQATPGMVCGHGEIDGAHKGSKSPGKPDACPGDLWDMDRFRSELTAQRADRATSALHKCGARILS